MPSLYHIMAENLIERDERNPWAAEETGGISSASFQYSAPKRRLEMKEYL